MTVPGLTMACSLRPRNSARRAWKRPGVNVSTDRMPSEMLRHNSFQNKTHWVGGTAASRLVGRREKTARVSHSGACQIWEQTGGEVRFVRVRERKRRPGFATVPLLERLELTE
jgi:hypothetical protein